MILPDDTVYPSSQLSHPAHSSIGMGVFPKIGIILTVQPSDAQGNQTADTHPQLRGSHQECTVLVCSDYGTPDTPIYNVIIPPQRHSGMDNFEEDLPRGSSQFLDGSAYNMDFSGVDTTKLDGEWCVVSFIGGNQQQPFLSHYWPHPLNNIDPATSGNTPAEGGALARIVESPPKPNLVQYDLKKNRSRQIHRKNGVLTMINREGSVYLDTSEAGRTVKLEGIGPTQWVAVNPISVTKRIASHVAKGGHIQVDVKPTAQLEINFNLRKGPEFDPSELFLGVEKGPRIGAGSNSKNPVHDPDLPHDDQPFTETKPRPRDTTRSFSRRKEFEVLEKTSSYNLRAENTTLLVPSGGKKGEIILMADDVINLTVAGTKATSVSMSGGKIIISNNDGSQINVTKDKVQMFTASGGFITITGNDVIVGATAVAISGSVSVAPGPLAQPVIKATNYLGAEETWLKLFQYFLAAEIDAWKAVAALLPGPPVVDAVASGETALDALKIFVAGLKSEPIPSPFATKSFTTS